MCVWAVRVYWSTDDTTLIVRNVVVAAVSTTTVLDCILLSKQSSNVNCDVSLCQTKRSVTHARAAHSYAVRKMNANSQPPS